MKGHFQLYKQYQFKISQIFQYSLVDFKEKNLFCFLAGWFENMNKVGDISGLILLDHVGSEKEHFLNILLNPTLIPASGYS